MTTILGSLGALWIVFAMFCVFAIGIMWPLMALSVTRNVKGIRVELQRLNETLARDSPIVDNRASKARPGALGI